MQVSVEVVGGLGSWLLDPESMRRSVSLISRSFLGRADRSRMLISLFDGPSSVGSSSGAPVAAPRPP